MFSDLSQKNIVIVEDSQEYKLLIKESLGHSPKHVYLDTIQETKEFLNNSTIDLIILDLILPDGNGLDLCRYLHQNNQIDKFPIIILSAQNEVTEKVLALNLGVVDYITKPFNPLEFNARVANKLITRETPKSSSLICGNLRVEMEKNQAFINESGKEKELNFTFFELKLLNFFISNQNSILSRNQLLEAVWGDNCYVLDRSVDSAIARLRKRLKNWDYKIKTIYGAGYKIILHDKRQDKPQLNSTSSSENHANNTFLEQLPDQITKLNKLIQNKKFDKALTIIQEINKNQPFLPNEVSKYSETLEEQLKLGGLSHSTLENFLVEIKKITNLIKKKKVS